MHSNESKLSTALVALALAAPLAAQTTTRVSVGSTGTQANQYSEAPSLSRDGRWVAFQSEATTLVAGDTNNVSDIFLHDRASATTTRISVSSAGVQSDGWSSAPWISADGRFVAFLSGATNLVAGDTNNQLDVFVHEVATAATTRVSVSTAGVQANGLNYAPVLSADGRFVAFSSAASNLVAGDTNAFWDVFVHDRQTATTVRAVTSSTGGQPNNHCAAPSISADGRFIAFHSNATNLITGDVNASWDVFVRDLLTSTTTRVSVDSNGVAGNGSCADASISDDGRFVVFHSAATNLVGNDFNAVEDVFLRDRQLGTTARVSRTSTGGEGDNVSRKARISGDGRYVGFESLATNMTPGDNNNEWDVFVHDRISGATSIVSVDNASGSGDYGSTFAALSGTGRYVAFQSYATNLVAGDTNNARDIFLRDRGPEAPISYCTAGTTTQGCVPVISAAGVPSASASSGFTIQVSTVDAQRNGLVFYGISGATEFPWSSTSTSFFCVKAPTQRMPLQNTGGTLGTCAGLLSYDFLAFMAANPGALGQPLAPGEVFYAQAWFRDPPASKATNLSAGLVFTLEP